MATKTQRAALVGTAAATITSLALLASLASVSTPQTASAAATVAPAAEPDAQPGTCAGGTPTRTPPPTPATVTGTARRAAYNWPLKPFNKQHPVRAFFNDPRIGRYQHVFHFGIDIAARDATPVYAVAAGRAWVSGESVAVVGARTFGYWHIRAAVATGAFIARHQLVGWVRPGWGHVHFAESLHHRYLNPLRSGALGPYVDRTMPTLAAAGSDHGKPHLLSGRVNLVAHAYDTTPVAVIGRWHDEPVTPALVRWRLLTGARHSAWKTAADFRTEMLPPSAYRAIYAPVTTQNHIGDPGLFCFNLVRGLDTRRLADGTYTLQVELRDTRNNRSIREVELVVHNAS